MADLELIKKVREQTGAGMVDVKRALEESGDDAVKAVEILRKAGQKIAEKKSSRTSKEGVIALSAAAGILAVVKVSCETDFVARNQDFIDTVQTFADKLLILGVEEFKLWADTEIKNNLIVKIGENIQLVGAEIIGGPVLGYYLHSNRKIASVVILGAGTENVAREIAMHVTAMSPKYLQPEEVDADVLAKEKEIIAEQLKNEGKPAEMIEKISQGKLQKFYSEVCLLQQPYIKDDKLSVEKFALSQQAKIEKFHYFSL
jgi:elongation factor Ts